MNNWSTRRRVLAPAAATVALVAGLAMLGGTAHAADAVTPLARDCSQTKLDIHTGFQEAPRCVETEFGEVAEQAKNPQLLIVDAPRKVRVGQPITLKVSTRNLVRDRFLGAAAGGYYLESSLLNDAGLTRGHFHTSCRMLASDRVAPQPDRAGNGLFVATEDGGGGARPTPSPSPCLAGCPPRARRSAPSGPATGRTASR